MAVHSFIVYPTVKEGTTIFDKIDNPKILDNPKT